MTAPASSEARPSTGPEPPLPVRGNAFAPLTEDVPPDVVTPGGTEVDVVTAWPSVIIVVLLGTVDLVLVDVLMLTVVPSATIVVVVVVGATVVVVVGGAVVVVVGAPVVLVVVVQPSGSLNVLLSVNSSCPLGK